MILILIGIIIFSKYEVIYLEKVKLTRKFTGDIETEEEIISQNKLS